MYRINTGGPVRVLQGTGARLAGYLCVLALCAKGLASDYPSANVF